LLVAATPLPLRPPPPDLTGLVPFVAAPLDKPTAPLPRLALPPVPAELPDLPPVALTLPRSVKPSAQVPVPRALACTFLTRFSASEALECGTAHFARGEFEQAAPVLEQAARAGFEEARYWLGETYYRLGRIEQADVEFRALVQSRTTSPTFALWARHSGGWTALRLGHTERARQIFDALVKNPQPLPPGIDSWAWHGLGLASYVLKRYGDAEQTWSALRARRPPQSLEREITFWHGEALGRVQQYARAAQELARFTQPADLHVLQWTALMRLGWRNLQAGFVRESVLTFRAFFSSTPAMDAVLAPDERQWAEAGMALALLQQNDVAGATKLLEGLDAKKSPVAIPVRMQLAALNLESGQHATAQSITQDLLGSTLPPTVRAWVLLLRGDADLAAGNKDEARTQYDLARQIDRTSVNGLHAALRLGRANFELREFGQAVQDVAPLLGTSVPADVRQAAQLITGEAAYQAGDFPAASKAYQALLIEAPDHAQAADARLGLGWSALRQNQRDDALRHFQEFGRANSASPHIADVLLLTSELLLAANNVEQAGQLMERIVVAHGSHPRAHFARLNRAILMVRTGQASAAQRDLRDWITRAPFPLLLGRAHAALATALLSTGRRAEAAKELELARQEGFTEFATLGLGVVALGDERWDDARKLFTDARDTGPTLYRPIVDYALAALAFHRGAPRDFERVAVAAIDEAPNAPIVPDLLYILIGLDAERGEWATALTMARRMVNQFADHEASDDSLERIGAAAAKASAWPVVHEVYGLLRQRYPRSPFVESSRVPYAQALIQTGRADEGRRMLEEFLTAYPRDERAPHAWLTLARSREAAGDRAGAMDAYGQAAQAPNAPWQRDARLSHARLLAGARRWEEARRAFDPDLRASEPMVVAETAYAIAETYEGQGDHLAAAEYYMTAAYVVPEAAVGQRALVAAGRSFAALKDADAAAAVYRKLLAGKDVPQDLEQAARKGLADLRR
jgi:tetratricopeptide (TPR) repeat protein